MFKSLRLSIRLNILTGLAVLGIAIVTAVFMIIQSIAGTASLRAIDDLNFSVDMARASNSLRSLEVINKDYIISLSAKLLPEIEAQSSGALEQLRAMKGKSMNPEWEQRLATLTEQTQDLGTRIVEAAQKQSSAFKTLPKLGKELNALASEAEVFSNEIALSSKGLVAERKAVLDTAETWVLAAVFTTPILIFLVAHAISSSIRKPIDVLITDVEHIKHKDFDKVQLPDEDPTTELGELTAAVKGFLDSEIDSFQKAKQIEIENMDREARMQQRDQRIAEFEAETARLIQDTAAATSQLESVSQLLTQQADVGQSQATEAGQAAENSMMAVNSVADSSNQLSVSISEISQQVQNALLTVKKSVDLAETSKTKVENLLEQAKSIGAISAIIRAISEQTNLLALNATIEAARAGEAGKGFAVVASEVKNLAQQIDKQTVEIDNSVRNIQSTSGETADAMDAIVNAIASIEGVNQSIAASVEEQSAETNEISSTADRTAEEVRSIAERVTSVANTSTETLSASRQVSEASETTVDRMTTLRTSIETFLTNLRDGNTLRPHPTAPTP